MQFFIIFSRLRQIYSTNARKNSRAHHLQRQSLPAYFHLPWKQSKIITRFMESSNCRSLTRETLIVQTLIIETLITKTLITETLITKTLITETLITETLILETLIIRKLWSQKLRSQKLSLRILWSRKLWSWKLWSRSFDHRNFDHGNFNQKNFDGLYISLSFKVLIKVSVITAVDHQPTQGLLNLQFNLIYCLTAPAWHGEICSMWLWTQLKWPVLWTRVGWKTELVDILTISLVLVVWTPRRWWSVLKTWTNVGPQKSCVGQVFDKQR